MYAGKLVFAQVMEFTPCHTFRRLVAKYRGNFNVRTFSCLDQFLSMAFAQVTFRESLRDIEACFEAHASKAYHRELRGNFTRSNLADANEWCDWRLYCEFAQALIRIARKLYATEPLGLELEETVYALDSTTIDRCLTLFPWAPFRSTKAAIKLHTLLDLRGQSPSFIHISDGKEHDVKVLDILIPEAGAFYVLDRGYLDFKRLYDGYFVTRAKRNSNIRRIASRPVERGTGPICDQTVMLNNFYAAKGYQGQLRRVRYRDSKICKSLVFLTNHFGIPALSVCTLYKSRWPVELFFKWIKQHLRIKRFFGTSEDAVKSQVWIAVSTHVLVAIARKRLNIDLSLHTMLQVLSVTPFEKIPLFRLFSDIDKDPTMLPTIEFVMKRVGQ